MFINFALAGTKRIRKEMHISFQFFFHLNNFDFLGMEGRMFYLRTCSIYGFKHMAKDTDNKRGNLLALLSWATFTLHSLGTFKM